MVLVMGDGRSLQRAPADDFVAVYDPLRDGYGALEVTAGARGSAPSEVRWDEFTITAR